MSEQKMIEAGTLEELREVIRKHPETVLCGEEVPYVTMRGFQMLKGIRAGFSTRLGGMSEGGLSTMNFSFAADDDPEKVQMNYRRFADSVGVNAARISGLDQIHSAEVIVVGKEDAGPMLGEESRKHKADGQITDLPGVALMVYGADCVPMLFADPVRHVVGTAHGGWRGTVQGIAGITVRRMSEIYGTDERNDRLCVLAEDTHYD